GMGNQVRLVPACPDQPCAPSPEAARRLIKPAERGLEQAREDSDVMLEAHVDRVRSACPSGRPWFKRRNRRFRGGRSPPAPVRDDAALRKNLTGTAWDHSLANIHTCDPRSEPYCRPTD